MYGKLLDMQHVLGLITGFVQTAGPFGVFVGSIAEELIWVLPSAVVQVSAGFFLLSGQPIALSTLMTLFIGIGIPAAIGVTIGSIPYYAAGRWGGEWFVKRYGRYVGVSEDKLAEVRAKLDRGRADEIFFGVARALPLVPSLILTIAAGLVRMPFWTYVFLSIIGTFVRSSILAFVGWQLGLAYQSAESSIGSIDTIVMAVGSLVVICIGSWYVIRKYQKKKSS